MIRSLYTIGADVLALGAVLDEVDGDPSKAGEGEAALMQWMESLESEQAAKLDGYLAYLRVLDMEAAQAKAERDEWAAKAKAREARADYLKRRLLDYLERTGQPKVTTAAGRVVSVVKNGGQVPMHLTETDGEKLPEEFQAVIVVPDKAAIRAALEAGRELDFARLLPRGTRLGIK